MPHSLLLARIPAIGSFQYKHNYRMERRSFVISLAATLCGMAVPATAQQSARLPVVGFLTSGGADSFAQFQSAMRDLGYIEGKNIVIERRSSAGELAPLKKLAAEL